MYSFTDSTIISIGSITAGDGDDSFIFTGSTITGQVSVISGNGDNSFDFSNSKIEAEGSYQGGSDKDTFLFSGATISANITFNNFETIKTINIIINSILKADNDFFSFFPIISHLSIF